MRLPLLLFFTVGLLLLLHWQFPYAAGTAGQQLRILYLLLLLMVIGGRSWLIRRMPRHEALRAALLWFGIIIFLMLVYNLYKDSL